ncbi:MAG: hypothetical protein NW204_09705 [Xanthomonadaceae bacterium]|nr:hypothetical protein [Xanthomonadaceae bacterium]
MNPILLALIGLPLLAGIYMRFALFDGEKLLLNIGVSSLVFLAVGIGYLFWTYSAPKAFFVGITDAIWAAMQFALVLILWLAAIAKGKIRAAYIFLVVLTFMLIIVLYVPPRNFPMATYCANVLIAFVVIAITNAILGTIAAGFTISATIHSYLTGSGLPDVYLWKDVFEFLEISSQPMRLLLLVAAALTSSAEAISDLFD